MKIRNIFGLTLAAAFSFCSCAEKDMIQVDEWLSGKFNQEIRWDVDSLAFRRADWQSQDVANGLQVRKASGIKMWDSKQTVSYMTYSPILYNTYLGYTGTEATAGDLAANNENAFFAINAGDFTNGKPDDFFKLDGEVIRENQSLFADAIFGLTVNEIDESTTVINAMISDDAFSNEGYTSALVAKALIVKDGVALENFPDKEFYNTRMARTIVGINNAGNCVLAVIDGGQTGKADGATVKEAAYIAQVMGLRMAALLGCGDQSTMWSKKDGVINSPSAGSAQKVGSVICVGPGTVTIDGTGSQASPYLIQNYVHMMLMRSFCPPDASTYWRLENDIDASALKLWTPTNFDGGFTRQIHFDGNNKTISNFAPDQFVADDQVTPAKYPSIFGVLYGSCKDLTIKDSKIVGDKEMASVGIVSGFFGTVQNGVSMPAEVENVHLENIEIEGKDDLGVFAGQGRDATVKNCTAKNVKILANGANAGGVMGRFGGKVEVENVTIENIEIYACSATASNHMRYGALLGYAATVGGQDLTRDKLFVRNCSTSGKIVSTEFTGNVASGIVGYMGMPEAEISECFTNLDLLSGDAWPPVSDGKLQNAAGMVGTCSAATFCKISNCYSTGKWNANQTSAGIVGRHEKGALTIENCYSTFDIYGYSGLGGILGASTSATACTVDMKGCFAWNPNIIAYRTSPDKYSSGGIAGSAAGVNTFAGCFRNPNMTFADPFRTIKEHSDLAGGTPALDTSDPDVTSAQNAFDGMPSTHATLIDAAKAAGWSEEIWDFSGEIPVLKWTTASDAPQDPEDPKEDCGGVCTECGCECTCDEHHSNK